MGMEEVERPKVLYHATKLINVDRILREGLKVNTPQSLVNKKVFNKKGVYLTTEQFGWMDWVTDNHIYKGAVISVNPDGLELIEDSDLLVVTEVNGSIDDRSLADYICPHDIPVENIIAVSIEQSDRGFIEEPVRQIVRGIRIETRR